MSFLLNLRAGLGSILGSFKEDDKVHFEVQVNRWDKGDKDKANYFGMCYVTPAFLREFAELCERHRCGERS